LSLAASSLIRHEKAEGKKATVLTNSIIMKRTNTRLKYDRNLRNRVEKYLLPSLCGILPIFTILLLLPSSVLAQLTVKTDRVNGNYAPGETVVFQITSQETGTANYTIGWDTRSPNLATGNVALVAGQTKNLTFKPAEPGFLLFSIAQGAQFAIAGAAVGAKDLVPLEAEPADFDAFWQGQKAKLAAVPIDPQLTQHSSTAYSTTWLFSLASVEGRRVYGYLTVPAGSGPFPAVISLPAFGTVPNIAIPETGLAEFGGVIAVSMNLHNAPPDQEDPLSYQPDDIADREKVYYKYGILAIVRIIDFLETRPDFDGKHVGLIGTSQGGGLALLGAGADPRVDLVVASNPALCEHAGLKFGKASGFPYYLQRSRQMVGTQQHESATLQATKYYDAVHFAKRFVGAAWLIAGYRDDVSPPATTVAAWNQLRGEKILTHLVENGHIHPADYWNGRYDFFRKHFPVKPPIPGATATGYSIDAGSDQTVNLPAAGNLAGKVLQNDQPLPNLPAHWEKVSGSGNVTFANPNAYQTAATFSAPGEYLLRFSVKDEQQLASEAKFYTLTDFVKISVKDAPAGNTPPSVELSVHTLHSGGYVTVKAQFNEPVTGLTANDFTLTQGTALIVTGSGETWFVFVQSNAQGSPVTIQLPANMAVDAGGAGNLASNVLTIQQAGGACSNVTNGGEISGDEAACQPFSPALVTSVAPASGGAGNLLYQWQRSLASANGPWSDVAGATAATYQPGQVTATTWFRRTARRSNCTAAGAASNVVVKKVAAGSSFLTAPDTYCPASGAQPWWEWISRVNLGNEAHDSFKDQYGDFSHFHFTTAPGETILTGLTPAFDGQAAEVFWRVWIDFNFDGDFDDAGERVLSLKGQGPVLGTISVPANTSEGAMRMRVAMRRDGFPSACGQFDRGEVEDYMLLVRAQIQKNYCSAFGEQPWWEWIARVDFGGMQKNSFKDQYADFTAYAAVVEKGENYPLFVTAGQEWPQVNVYFRAWIDFNADGDFDDPGETVLSQIDTALAGGQVFIPQNAKAGPTRMRIAATRNAFPTACQTLTHGEVEDYLVIIGGCSPENRLAPLLDFEASLSQGSVQTWWVTNTDFKNERFVVERATGGSDFQPLAEIFPNSDTDYPNLYHWTDDDPQPGTNLYRLRQMHRNGSFRLSELREIKVGFEPEEVFVFPNPAGHEAFLLMRCYEGEPCRVQVLDAAGVVVKKLAWDAVPSTPVPLPLEGLGDGAYFLQITAEGFRPQTRRLIVGRF
jgi:cephalosporin-C deacetylase-like acetyl esterase